MHVSCRWCREVIHHPPEKLVAVDLPADGWVHAQSQRPHCRDAQHRAEPAPAPEQPVRIDRIRAAEERRRFRDLLDRSSLGERHRRS